MSSEIESIIRSPAEKVIICGEKTLKLPMGILLNNNSDKEVVCIPDGLSTNAATYGMIKIYEYVSKY